MSPLVLASSSPARARLLRDAGLDVSVRPAPISEPEIKRTLIDAGLDALALATRLAEAKAVAAPATAEEVVLGADQTLEMDGDVLDKPGDLSKLRFQLQRLQGRSHWLHAAAALVRAGQSVWTGASSVKLTMRPLSEAQLDAYVESEGHNVLGCVGGYRLEGPGVQLFEAVEGEYFAVLGLPLLGMLGALRAIG